MAKDSTNTSTLPSFSALKDSERRAVILKSEGKINEQITAHINDEFALDYSVRTITEWFQPAGKLKQAYDEYNEALALTSLAEARQLIKRASKGAVTNLIAKIKSPDDSVSLRASMALLNKYIPDKQVMLDKDFKEEELPSELAAYADSLREAVDGPQQVDDSSVGSEDK